MKSQADNKNKIARSQDKLDALFANAFKDVCLQVRVGGADLMSAGSPSKTGRCC